MISPFLLRLVEVRRGLLAVAALCVAFGGYAFAFSIAFQEGLGFDPLFSCLSLLPMALGAFIASLCSAKVITRFGAGAIAWGGALQSLGFLLVLAASLLW